MTFVTDQNTNLSLTFNLESSSLKFSFNSDISQGYGRGTVKMEQEDRHMNVNVSSSNQGTKTVILQIPKVENSSKAGNSSLNLSVSGYPVKRDDEEKDWILGGEEEDYCE